MTELFDVSPVTKTVSHLEPQVIFLFLKKIIYFWLYRLFVAVHSLSLVVSSRGYSCCRARASGTQASGVAALGAQAQHCGSQA